MIRAMKLALAPLGLLLASIFMAVPAWADYSGNCAGAPTGTYTGNVTITDTTGTCTLPGPLTARGFIKITGSGTVTTDLLKSTGSASNGYITINAVGAINVNGTIQTANNIVTLETSGANAPITAQELITTNNVVTVETIGSSSNIQTNEITATNSNAIIETTGSASTITIQTTTANVSIADTLGYVLISASGTVNVTGSITTSGNSTFSGNVTVQTTGANAGITTKEITTTDSLVTVGTSGSSSSIQTNEIAATNSNAVITAIGSGSNITIQTTTADVSIADTLGYVYINATGTVTVTGSIKTSGGNTQGFAGDVQIEAGSTLQTQSITTTLGGNVDLKSQMTTGNAVFTIGGTSGSNGVNGVITSAGGTAGTQSLFGCWVYVTNGPSGNSNGITVVNPTAIVVPADTGTRAGTIVLDAQNGTLTVTNAGTMAVTGTASAGAGQINLFGATVTFSAAVTLDASQTYATGFGHQVNISAATINYTSGLTITSNGAGGSLVHGQGAFYSQGAFTVVESGTVGGTGTSALTIMVNATGNTPSSLTLNGGALSITSNGDNDDVLIQGYPITISGTTVALTSQGKTSTLHEVKIQNLNPTTGSPGLIFNNSGTVTLDASASAGADDAGGFVVINVDQLALNGAGPYTLKANGPTSLAGNGGEVYIETSSAVNFPNGGNVTISANAPHSGNGGIVIVDSAAAVTIAGAQINTSASGTTGAGGEILIDSTGTGTNGIVTLTGAINVNSAGSGEAGDIMITGDTLALDGSQITANGGTTGNGGTVTLSSMSVSEVLSIGETSVTTISAKGGTTSGNGSSSAISITGNNAITIGQYATIDSSQAVKGNGGNIAISASTIVGPITIAGNVYSEGGETSGNGGNVTLTTQNQGSQDYNITATGNIFSAGSNDGASGVITITSNDLVPQFFSQGMNIAGTLSTWASGTSQPRPTGDIVFNLPAVPQNDYTIAGYGMYSLANNGTNLVINDPGGSFIFDAGTLGPTLFATAGAVNPNNSNNAMTVNVNSNLSAGITLSTLTGPANGQITVNANPCEVSLIGMISAPQHGSSTVAINGMSIFTLSPTTASITADNITLSTANGSQSSGDNDVSLDQPLNADLTVSITTSGSGEILDSELLTAGTLNLQTAGASIDLGNTKATNINVVQPAGISDASVAIRNEDAGSGLTFGVTIPNVTTSGILGTGGVTLNSSAGITANLAGPNTTTPFGGAFTVTASSGPLTLNFGGGTTTTTFAGAFTATAGDGTLSLNGGTLSASSVNIQSPTGQVLIAVPGVTSTAGAISIVGYANLDVGTCNYTAGDCPGLPPFFTVVSAGTVIFGNPLAGEYSNGPAVVVSNSEGTSITLNGNYSSTMSPPNGITIQTPTTFRATN